MSLFVRKLDDKIVVCSLPFGNVKQVSVDLLTSEWYYYGTHIIIQYITIFLCCFNSIIIKLIRILLLPPFSS